MKSPFIFLYQSHRSEKVKDLVFTIHWLYTNRDPLSEATKTEENEVHHLIVVLLVWKHLLEFIFDGCRLVPHKHCQATSREEVSLLL